MDDCNAVKWRSEGRGHWPKPMPVVDFKKSLKPKAPVWFQILVGLAMLVFFIGMTVDLSVP